MYFRSYKKLSCEVSLEEPIEPDSDCSALALKDVLSCNDDALERIELNDRIRLISGAMQVLEPREKEIISLRYGLGGHTPLTQREVARLHGISRSYVSRIEKKALQKLRAEFGTIL